MLSLLKFIYLFLFLKNLGSHAVSYHCVRGPRAFSQVERITVFWRVWPVLAGAGVVAPSCHVTVIRRLKKIPIRKVEGQSNSSRTITSSKTKKFQPGRDSNASPTKILKKWWQRCPRNYRSWRGTRTFFFGGGERKRPRFPNWRYEKNGDKDERFEGKRAKLPQLKGYVIVFWKRKRPRYFKERTAD